MDSISTRIAQAARAMPALSSATVAMYGCGAALLVAGAATWQPGKNPRWVIVTLAVVAAVFVVWTLVRGAKFSRLEALVMASVQLATVGCLTWTTNLALGAFANGTILPIVGVYIIWFLHPVAGRVVLYAGAAWWFTAILHQQNSTIVPFAASVIIQTIVAVEVFSRVKMRVDRLARTDPLTHMLNRRGITEVLELELDRATRRGMPISVVAVDLDGLREVNNTLGHQAGDDLLMTITQHWSRRMRRGDAIGRIGGDEFIFVLPGTTIDQAETIVDRLAATSPGAWSAGVADVTIGDTVTSLLERADRRMYVAKASRYGA